MNQAVATCHRSGWIDTTFTSLHADAVQIHCPPIHILVQPRYIHVLSYALLPSTIQVRRTVGMAISLNRQETGSEFVLRSSELGDQKRRPVADAPRGHISLEIKVHVRGTRNHSTNGSDCPYMRMTILYVHISRAIAGADAIRCRTPSEWTAHCQCPACREGSESA
jgi:hypothetical protein